MRKHCSNVCKLRPCLATESTNSAHMRTIVTSALQRQYSQTELTFWIPYVFSFTQSHKWYLWLERCRSLIDSSLRPFGRLSVPFLYNYDLCVVWLPGPALRMGWPLSVTYDCAPHIQLWGMACWLTDWLTLTALHYAGISIIIVVFPLWLY